MDTSVMNLLILCLQEKLWLNIQIFFHQIILRRMMIWFCLILNKNKSSSIKAIDKTILSEQTKLRLSEIIGNENYLYQEIDKRKSCSKKLKKHVTAFDYIDKILIILSGTTSGILIISVLLKHQLELQVQVLL